MPCGAWGGFVLARTGWGWGKKSHGLEQGEFEFESERGFYAQSASEPEAIFRARAYSHNVFSPVMMIT